MEGSLLYIYTQKLGRNAHDPKTGAESFVGLRLLGVSAGQRHPFSAATSAEHQAKLSINRKVFPCLGCLYITNDDCFSSNTSSV